MEIQKNIGKTLLLRVEEEFIKKTEHLLEAHTGLFYARLVATDEMGIWVENPYWETNMQGKQESSYFKIHVLIPWNQLISVGMFPDGEFSEDEASWNTNVSKIGFKKKGFQA